MFSSPFTTRPPRRSDWAGGPRGVAALASVAVAVVVEVVALVVATSSASAGAVVALVAVLLVPVAAFLCGYAGAWRGPARRWGIGAGILLVLPPVGVLFALLPLSFLYVIAVGVIGFAGHLIGRRREPERRFD